MLYCTDPRHETPCPQPCAACDDECEGRYVVELDQEEEAARAALARAEPEERATKGAR